MNMWKEMGMLNRYYSFDMGNFHFVVLDGNNYSDGIRNYSLRPCELWKYPYSNHSYMDKKQMEWLEKDLASTNLKTVLLSHQSIDSELKTVLRQPEYPGEQTCGV